ncbi:lutropin-choriogonadotropic hormone receptor [Anabrus simplex]|uniref:lutropin-choriogonadotropic hormone receptor n=1 Tax=Anabrus simplex TaxID=316456 RepID=UPI0035A2BE73
MEKSMGARSGDLPIYQDTSHGNGSERPPPHAVEHCHVQTTPCSGQGVTHVPETVVVHLGGTADSVGWNLNYNLIEEVDEWAFNGSQIATISLKGNRRLRHLDVKAFADLRSLRYIDLSETSVTQLPTTGLHELEVLRIEDTESLKVFPSVYHFTNIKEAQLTYPYHCCAFAFPARHNPIEEARHQKIVQRCAATTTPTPLQRSRRQAGDLWNISATGWGRIHPLDPITNNSDFSGPEVDGMFHPTAAVLTPGTLEKLCGTIVKNYRDVRCYPVPDAFNPCEDLMGNWWLRIFVWLVALLALLGNLAVLIVMLSSRFRMTVPKFLMCNLAVADLCMGVYLLLIAIMDSKSMGQYFNYAIDWQSGYGCQVAGFLTVFSSELSIYTLTVITAERWYTITYAIHLNRRLKISTAGRIMILGWIYSGAMAVLPLVGVSGYSKTSICLPMENSERSDLVYLTTLLTFNGLAFVLICVFYVRMYCAIRGGQDAVTTLSRSDMTVAKRMALLVFTDFACWAPIAFFGLTALSGYPLIDVTRTKILLVFFYPLNSCANPYLYALLTKSYRRDFFILLSRYGLFTQRAAHYKGATGTIPRGGIGGFAGTCGNRGVGVIPEFGAPRHRGSLLTTLTSVDSANPRPGSLTAVPEAEYKLSAVELAPLTGNKHISNHMQRKDLSDDHQITSAL